MNSFPPAHPQLPPARRSLGALTLTPDLQAAAQALVTRLSAGCVATVFDECSAFQQAYINAGGSITLDGLYGAQTRAALQSVLTTVDGSVAPAACVGSIVPVLSPTVPATAPNSGLSSFLAPGTTVNLPLVGAVQTRTLVVGAAGLLAAWLVGSAIWRRVQEGGLGIHQPARVRHSQMPTRRHRRRNPARHRRVREKARVRAESQTRDEKTGRFRKG